MIKKSFVFLILLNLQFSCYSMISRFMNQKQKDNEYSSIDSYNSPVVIHNLNSVNEDEDVDNDLVGTKSMISSFMNQKKEQQEYFPGDPVSGGVCKWAYEGDLELVKEAIYNGYDINLANKFGETPLMYAAMSGNADMVIYLLDNGAVSDLKDKRGYSAVIVAAELGRSDIVEILINVDLQDFAQALDVARKQLKRMNKHKDKFKEGLLETIETLRGYSKSFLASHVQKHFPEDNVSEIIMSYIK